MPEEYVAEKHISRTTAIVAAVLVIAFMRKNSSQCDVEVRHRSSSMATQAYRIVTGHLDMHIHHTAHGSCWQAAVYRSIANSGYRTSSSLNFPSSVRNFFQFRVSSWQPIENKASLLNVLLICF